MRKMNKITNILKKMGNILIVDDDKFLCQSLLYILKDEGYDVNAVNDGKTAINLIKKRKYDLMVLDYNLSTLQNITGLGVLEKALEINPRIKAVMISAHGDNKLKKRAKDMGVNGFIDKPFKLTKLLKTIYNSMRNTNDD
jgi:DNA-binding NtrC family response regulator